MKLNIHSITFKTLLPLGVFAMLFIAFIALNTKSIFSTAYLNLEKEKILIIENTISPSLALNMSYGFNQAIDEIGNLAIKNPNILLLIIKKESEEEKIFTQKRLTLDDYIQNREIVSTTELIDPTTNIKIGEMTLVYSKKNYEEYMQKFYKLFIWGVLTFILSIILLAYMLYKSLKNLQLLAASLNDFDPNNPKELHLQIRSKDEISSIIKSADMMINNLVKYLNNSKELNQQLTQNQTHLKDAQRIANVGSWEYNIEENHLKLSDEIYRILHIKKLKDISWGDFLSFISQDEREYVNRVFENAIKNGSSFDVKYSVFINSRTIYIRTRGKVRKKADSSTKITAVSMDITEDTINKKTIENLAYHDALTQLPNRSLLKDRAHKALQNASRTQSKVALIFLDLDHFKLINDTLGHDTGDKLLVYVSKLLKNQLRASDTLARLGGDEFVILLPDIKSIDNAEYIAQKVLDVFQGQHIIETHQLYITTSIGISIYPDNSQNMDELITNADTAMYDAKQDGRNNYKKYSKEMGNYISSQMTIEQDLKEAINTQIGLEVFYQAKINSNNSFISGAEALIRWNHPTKGLIFPDDFIPVAESTGMIIEMGNWIIKECMIQLQEWNRAGFGGIKVAINLSPRQFQDKNLVPYIYKLIQSFNIQPEQLEFEITETLSMTNMDSTMRILQELKNIGVNIAIDDFGTGYSSLSYLKKFPVNTLKIDKSFVMEMTEKEEDKVIVQTIISMAHSLGFKTVAEGVETMEHVKLLKNMDCDELQGYYFTKAISKAEFMLFLQNYLPNKHD